MAPVGRFIATSLLGLVATLPVAAQTQVFRAARLWPGDGPAITDAVLVVKDGRIEAVGRRDGVKLPADVAVKDLGDVTLIPGLIAAETGLAERGRDDVLAFTPHHRAIDGFDWYADFSNALSGGVTTVQIVPGSRRVLPGQGAVVKLHGDDLEHRALRSSESMRILLGDAARSAPRIYEPPVGAVSVDRPLEPTRAQLGGSQASAVAGLRAALAAGRTGQESPDPFVRALATPWSQKLPLRVTTPGAVDLQSALTLAREFNLRLLLVEPPVAKDKLAGWKGSVDGVVLGTGVRPGAITENAADRVPAESARDLRAAGIRVAIKPENDNDLKEFLYLGSLFTTHVSRMDALKMLTVEAAQLLGVAERVGTLAPGKDADFVVLTGEPFGLRSQVKATYVDGELAWEAKPVGGRKVLRASRILTGNGDVIANGAVLVDGKSIRAVGTDVSVPADAEEKNYGNAVIVPGFLDLGTKLGLGGAPSGALPFTGKIGERLVQGDAGMKNARQGGVTTVFLSGTAPSAVLAFKLGDKPSVLKEPVALRFGLRGNLTTAGSSLRDTLRAGKTYADSWKKYEADLAAYEVKKKEFDANQPKAPATAPATPKAEEKKAEKKDEKAEPAKDEKKDEKKEEKKEEKKPEPPKEPTKPQVNEAMEPYKALFAGKLPTLVEADREDAIKLAVAICRDEYDLKLALLGADDAYRVADLLAAKGVTVITGPELVRTVEREEVNVPLAMSLRGVAVGFQSEAAAGARHLPLAVGYAVRRGLGATDALRGLTMTPAQFFGLDNVGTVATGRDADLVILSGMPFEPSTRVLAVMIDGQWVHREAEQKSEPKDESTGE